jgi:hypothetical protein
VSDPDAHRGDRKLVTRQRRCAIVFSLVAAMPVAASEVVAEAHSNDADVITRCAQSPPEDEAGVGLAELDKDCPGLKAALTRSGVAPFLSSKQSSELTYEGLEDLAQLRRRYQPGANQRTLNVGEIANIVRDLTHAQSARPLSLKERFLRWLHEKLQRRQSSPADNWLSRWLREVSLPDKARELITYALIVAVVILALVVIVTELRAAGVLKRTKQKRHDAGIAGELRIAELTFADLDAAALRDKPSVMLQLILAALVKSGRLQSERSLTRRELIERVAFDEQSQRDRFRDIARGAEYARYASTGLNAQQIEMLLAQGRVMHAALTGTRKSP